MGVVVSEGELMGPLKARREWLGGGNGARRKGRRRKDDFTYQ